MTEKDFEDILVEYPELIEDNLKFIGRQMHVYGRRMDILFEDRFNRKLIVELKKGPIKDEHMGQVLSYEGSLLSGDDPTVRVMLIGNRVPPNIRRALDHHGIAWKEITQAALKEFLTKKKDNNLVALLEDVGALDESVATVSKEEKMIARSAAAPYSEVADKTAFFERMESTWDEQTVGVARKIHEWAENKMLHIRYGGSHTPTFYMQLSYQHQKRSLFGVENNGKVFLSYEQIQRVPPFDNPSKSREFLDRLNEIDGIDIPYDRKMPSIPMSAFHNQSVLQSFIGFFDWVVSEMIAARK